MEDCLESSRLARNKGPDALCAAMAKVAVDRSGGSLEMFDGKNFVTDKLLKYIGDRYSTSIIFHHHHFTGTS